MNSLSNTPTVPAPTAPVLTVLFLCTANSARSILSESLLNGLGAGRVRAHSAGSHPGGVVNPYALALLREHGLPTEGLRSKSWDEFAAPGAARIDCVITVCDNAAGEVCPLWPGAPLKAHWGAPDPAAAVGSDAHKRRAFQNVYALLRQRVERLLALPLATMDRAELKRQLDAIGAA